MKMNTAAVLPCLALALAAGAPAARADVVMIVSAHSALAPSVEQVCQAFLGKIKTPTPINLSEKNPTRDEFYSKACKKEPAQVRAMRQASFAAGARCLAPAAETMRAPAKAKAPLPSWFAGARAGRPGFR